MEETIILHLSDLHFGDVGETAMAVKKNVLDGLLETVQKLEKQWKPQAVFISGDIGWQGSEGDYALAEVWLKKLLTSLGLEVDALLPCPGNHDIDLDAAETVVTPKDAGQADKYLRLEKLEKFSEPFEEFAVFCERIKVPPLKLGSKESFLVGTRVVKGVRVVVLNSAWFCRKGKKEKLHIGLPHLEVITSEDLWKKEDIFTVGILHHPPSHLRDEEQQSYEGRANTYDLLAGECDMILSGHVHGLFDEPDKKFNKAWLFTGGSCYSSEKVRNNFSIYRIGGEKDIERKAFEWNPTDRRWEERANYCHSFPSQRKPKASQVTENPAIKSFGEFRPHHAGGE
ncbi:MAG: hypothetical protein GY765_10420 [bacterium]|nr:hypothetical protein [bacterium]